MLYFVIFIIALVVIAMTTGGHPNPEANLLEKRDKR